MNNVQDLPNSAQRAEQRPRGLLLKGLAGLLTFAVMTSSAVGSAATSSDFAAYPPSDIESAAPLVMLLLSHDHQLYIKAYNDYSDLDNDGVIDSTYNDAIDYAGYFDSAWCYAYQTDRFQPRKVAVGTNAHSCPDTTSGAGDGPWSGNFLNWATMSRMDVVRRTLYGGKRVTDPAAPAGGPVILERALLPPDLHAFAKVASGADLDKLTPYSAGSTITLCNVTPAPTGAGKALTQNLDTAAYPPKIRIAAGPWPNWAASDIKLGSGTDNMQCGWGGSSSNARPDSTEELTPPGGLNARVEACVAGLDGATSEHCREYTNGNIKPIGLLQEFGENKGMRFGLLTGSYSGARRGGLLRRNIGFIADNPTDEADKDEINLTTGQFKNQGLTDTSDDASATYPGVINTMNRLRISRYNYDTQDYADCSSSGISAATFNNIGSDTSQVACRDWGNPLAELYAEALRYFSWQGAAAAFGEFAVDDSGHINNLKPVGWVDPQPADDDCAQCAIVVLSTGLGNFDGMQAGPFSNGEENQLPSGITGFSYAELESRMLQIGTIEDINGSYFIGQTGTEHHTDPTIDRCTAKNLTPATFINARGLCPEMPNLRGSYHLAGLAYHAKNQDMRSDRDGKQRVGTYAVQLAELLPSFEIDVEGKTVTFLPYCRATQAGNERQCALVNVEVIDGNWHDDGTGELLISWEDASWGSDYDMDGKQQLKFCVGAACADPIPSYQIRFTVDADFYKRDQADMQFGYIIGGTFSDGPYLDIEVDNKTQPSLVTDAPDPVSRIFTPGIDSVANLENPLWYAAKYGSFNDIDGDGTPLHNGDPANKVEWDVKDSDGLLVPGGDGIPDNFYHVRNPGMLTTRMRAIFQSLTSAVQSRTSAAVISTTGRGIGSVYQAIYYPQFERKDALGEVVDSILWAGALNAIFIDDRGRLREDNGTKYKLESSTIDFPISIYFDHEVQQTLVQRFDDNDNPLGPAYPLREMEPIWSANHSLAEIADVVTQRTYSDNAGTGRHILTWIDRNLDGVVNNGLSYPEVYGFQEGNFPEPSGGVIGGVTNEKEAHYKWLGLTDAQAEFAPYLVNFIRGKDYAGGSITIDANTYYVRSRTIDFDDDGSDEVWRLGDIIHSSPTVVAAPSNSEFTSASYLSFQQHYESRRQVVYIGANDGMIHAFNGGFFDSATLTFAGGGDLDGDGDTSNDPDFHDIGSELWAYVPGNLLPHLRWLVEPDYPHVYYMDGAIQVFDAQIFDATDPDHPGGWGTILVAGMRFGGGEITVSVKNTGSVFAIGSADENVKTSSAYVVLDVTNPEKAPTLIAELRPDDNSFTVSNPTVVRRTTGGADDEWLLVFGNGPDDLSTGTTGSDASLYVYDLMKREPINVAAANPTLHTALDETNSFFGNFARVDWKTTAGSDGIDGSDDAIFVGTVGGSNASPTGVLKKIVLDTAATNLGFDADAAATAFTLVNADKPISSAPITTRDTRKTADIKEWVSFATGRFLVPADSASASEQAYYGVLNPTSATSVDLSAEGIIDLTEVVVLPDSINNVQNRDGSAVEYTRDSITTTFTRYKPLARFVEDEGGWIRRFQTGYPGHGAERNMSDPAHFGSTLLFTSYLPSTDSCTVGGLGFLYGINAFSGLPPEPRGALGTGLVNGTAYALERVGLGNTLPSKPVVHSSAVGGSKAIVQGSRGEFVVTDLFGNALLSGRQSWREVQGIEFLLTD